jgi:hypothetical protein
MAERGPGRPLGSVNRLASQWSSYIQSQYGSPLDIAAAVGAMSLAEIAEKLGCDRVTAAELRLKCWEFTARYTHQEMPRDVAVDAAVEGDGGLAAFLAPAVAMAIVAKATDSEDDPPSDC